jgi:hypothetical protein
VISNNVLWGRISSTLEVGIYKTRLPANLRVTLHARGGDFRTLEVHEANDAVVSPRDEVESILARVQAAGAR